MQQQMMQMQQRCTHRSTPLIEILCYLSGLYVARELQRSFPPSATCLSKASLAPPVEISPTNIALKGFPFLFDRSVSYPYISITYL